MLQTIGKLVWGGAGWAMPSLGLIPYFVAAGLMVLSLTATVAYYKGAEGKAASVTAERSACEIRISEGAAASAQTMAELLASIKSGEDNAAEPKTSIEEKELCRKSKLCRPSSSR